MLILNHLFLIKNILILYTLQYCVGLLLQQIVVDIKNINQNHNIFYYKGGVGYYK